MINARRRSKTCKDLSRLDDRVPENQVVDRRARRTGRRLDPRMTTKSHDLNLRKDVLEELEWDPSIVDARTIGVAVEGGIIALTGHVGSYADKTNAEKIAKRVHGVQGVAKVKLSTSFERDDVDIARSAVNALEWNVSVPKNRIKVTVTKGWAMA